MRKFLFICSLLILTSLQSPKGDISQGFMIPLLTTPASVRAQALGNAGVTDIGSGSHTINPASLALRGNNGFVSVSLFPTKAIFRSAFDDIGFNFYGLSVGIPHSKNKNSSNISVGLAFNYYKLDYGVFSKLGEADPTIISTFEIFDETYNGTFSVAIRGKYQFGVGLTFRYFKSVRFDSSSINGTLLDFGVLLKRSFGGSKLDQQKSDASLWRITPSIGISVLNIGSDQSYFSGAQKDSPPKLTRVGSSVGFELVAENHTFFSIAPLFEAEKLQLPGRAYIWHFGGEVGIEEIVYFLIGRFNDPDTKFGQTSWGIRFSTQGLSHLFGRRAAIGTNSRLLDQLSFEISYANYVKNQPGILSNTKFLNLGAAYEF